MVAGSKGRVALVVVDSLTSLYRLACGTGAEPAARQRLAALAALLVAAARDASIAAIITNEVFADLATGRTLPLRAEVIEAACALTIRSERLRNSLHRFHVAGQERSDLGSVDLDLVSERGAVPALLPFIAHPGGDA